MKSIHQKIGLTALLLVSILMATATAEEVATRNDISQRVLNGKLVIWDSLCLHCLRSGSYTPTISSRDTLRTQPNRRA